MTFRTQTYILKKPITDLLYWNRGVGAMGDALDEDMPLMPDEEEEGESKDGGITIWDGKASRGGEEYMAGGEKRRNERI